MSAVAYPPQIQDRLASSARVVTVVVRADSDLQDAKTRSLEQRTGRIIEARNPGSKWVLLDGESHAGVKRHWPEHLKYILQFSNKK